MIKCTNTTEALKQIEWYALMKQRNYGQSLLTLDEIVGILLDIPAADVIEARHGKWKFHTDGSGTCDQCHHTALNVWDYDSWQNFCGHCGADMRGGDWE